MPSAGSITSPICSGRSASTSCLICRFSARRSSRCYALDPAFLRVNHEVLGNALPILHGHVHARYRWGPEPYRRGPIWRYPDRASDQHRLDHRHDRLRTALTAQLQRVTAEAYL